MELFIIFVFLMVPVIFGAICWKMADTRGRSNGLGFLAGFFFGIFAIIYYLLAGNSNKKQIEIMRSAINKE